MLACLRPFQTEADDDVPATHPPARHEPFSHIGVRFCETPSDSRVVAREHEDRLVDRIGERTCQEDLSAIMRILNQFQVVVSQGGAALDVVVNEVVHEQPVHRRHLR